MTTLAIETSCDETAAAVLDSEGNVLASEIATQIDLHRAYGGVVPEVASRNHLLKMRPVLLKTLEVAGVSLPEIDVFSATAGPGLAGALLTGNTTAKALALAHKKPFISVNHMEGHLLSPFMGQPAGIQPCVALVVSGGHTMLIHLREFGDYHLCGNTRDDAAGEAFDKVAKMIGLPYPGGPEIDKLSKVGDPKAYDFPRSMLSRKDHDFSFSGLKTAVLYSLDKLNKPLKDCRPDLCASFQEAVVDVLTKKTIRLAQTLGESCITVSGGVSCNSRLRKAFEVCAHKAGLKLLIAPPSLTTDNAAMIAYVAWQKAQRGLFSMLEEDVDPNLKLAEATV
ncbi:MAG: tRNA (adenosine(37)-N6)-threonylcarbamoyltransferase complex transferase subunit TsaD [Verrucomicrobiaceae bacterium]|nr:tRNA (adenosine(37)-N6)-threonylcarbamoyltransferase complex transferase subunit TsaD [Verrucomicrobiaceae bacterium]